MGGAKVVRRAASVAAGGVGRCSSIGFRTCGEKRGVGAGKKEKGWGDRTSRQCGSVMGGGRGGGRGGGGAAKGTGVGAGRQGGWHSTEAGKGWVGASWGRTGVPWVDKGGTSGFCAMGAAQRRPTRSAHQTASVHGGHSVMGGWVQGVRCQQRKETGGGQRQQGRAGGRQAAPPCRHQGGRARRWVRGRYEGGLSFQMARGGWRVGASGGCWVEREGRGLEKGGARVEGREAEWACW